MTAAEPRARDPCVLKKALREATRLRTPGQLESGEGSLSLARRGSAGG